MKDIVETICQMLPENINKAIVFVFSSEERFYFVGDLLLNDGKAEYREDMHVHGGLTQDSVLIKSSDRFDFRYFPFTGNWLEFYMWDDRYGSVYAYNCGNERIEVTCSQGDFVILPGELKLLDEDSKAGQGGVPDDFYR